MAKVVLPRCNAALAGLVTFRNEFHPSRIINDETISTLNKNGSTGAITKDRAVTSYLRRLRNAGHGLRKELDDTRFLSILVSHEGNVPAAVSDIAFLHLVRLVANPDLILPSDIRYQRAR